MNRVGEIVKRDVPLLVDTQTIEEAIPILLKSELPALPVVDERQKLAGIFGEREFMTALFPGYVGQLGHAGFVPKSIDAVLEKREACSRETVRQHMNTERIDVAPDFSDVQIAEIFLHHRVLIIPVYDKASVLGVITRSEFFAVLAERFLASLGERS